MASINLLPEEMRKDIPAEWLTVGFKLVFPGFFFLIAGFCLTFTISIYVLKIQIAKLDTELMNLSPQTVHAIELEKEISQIEEQIAALQNLEAKQSFWHELLRDISGRTPLNLWLTGFSVSSDLAITINGQSLDFKSVSLFLNQLNQSSFLTGAQLIKIEAITIDDKIIHGFEFMARLSNGRRER